MGSEMCIRDRSCKSEAERDWLTMKYIRFLWDRRELTPEAVTDGPLVLPVRPEDRTTLIASPQRWQGRNKTRDNFALVKKVPFEKTPAYLDMADPALFACVAPQVSRGFAVDHSMKTLQQCLRPAFSPHLHARRQLTLQPPPFPPMLIG